ncbi:MAG: hypothetical protein ACI8W0_001277 [Flavobacterium sp.]|jgi:hypothetical protein
MDYYQQKTTSFFTTQYRLWLTWELNFISLLDKMRIKNRF